MAWVKTDKDTTINLDNIISIQIFTVSGKYNIVFTDVKSGYYSSQKMSKEECRKVYDLILSKRCLDFTSPHVACMTIGPKKRNINGDSKNDKDRYIVCVRCNFIKEDIIN